MSLIRYRPATPLAHYIDCFWLSHRETAQDFSEHMLPSGAAHLLFALHDVPLAYRARDCDAWTSWSGSIVRGPQATFYQAGPKPKGCVVGVAFRPGTAAIVLGVALHELANRHVELEALWGRRGIDLRDRLLSATLPADIFRILEAGLNERLHRPLLIHPAIAHALAARDAIVPTRVADVQRASGYSPRHFNVLFESAVGLKPKHFYRLQRFNQAVRCMAARDDRGLSDIAAAAYYSDQAHLTREFRELAGVAPTRYRASGSDRPLHHRVTETMGPGR